MSNEPNDPAITVEEAKRRFGGLSLTNYHGATDQILRELEQSGQSPPKCPRCGEPMFAADDHGRFTCACNLGSVIDLASDDDF